MVLLLFCSLHSSAQVSISNPADAILCSTTNGKTDRNQEAFLLVQGPEKGSWCFSYSINNAPPIAANLGNPITTPEFTLPLKFRNESSKAVTYTIKLESAWNEKDEPIPISTTHYQVDLKVLPLPDPEIKDYPAKAWSNRNSKYQALIGKNSNFEIKTSPKSQLVEVLTGMEENRKLVDFTIKWPSGTQPQFFQLIEVTPMNCNSDTVYAGVELTDHFTLEYKSPVSLCQGQELQLAPKPDIYGDYKYLWNTGAETPSIKVTKAGDYQVQITETNVNQTETITIKVISVSPPNLQFDKVMVLEEGKEIEMKIPGDVSSCLWSTGETTPTIQINSPGEYWVTAQSAEGCSATNEFKVIPESEAFHLELPSETQLCFGELILLRPTLSVDQDYNFKWNTGATTKNIEINQPGEYSVEVTAPNGLIRKAKTMVIEHPLPIVNLGENITLWEGESRILDAKNPGASYLWSTGHKTQTLEVTSGGYFSVTVTDQFNCFAADEIFVDFRKGQRFGVDLGEDPTICQGDSILILPQIDGNPNPPLNYRWSPVANNEPEIYLKTEGEHCLEVTDGNGNIEKGCISVEILPSPEVDLGADLTALSGETVELDAGNPGQLFEWSTGEITQKIQISKPGKYAVKVTNTHNCSTSDTISVEFKDELPIAEIPLAFSPNGDGQNDILYIKGEDIKTLRFLIFNRLGQKVFESRNQDYGWDGYFDGELQRIDVYVYFADITYINGKTTRQKGNISLLR